MPFFNIRDLIIKKRDGKPLNKDEIQYFVDCVSKNNIEECQLGAILMAVYLQGMTPEETSHLTRCMMRSGEMLEWPEQWKGIIVDKHSTGGVGDKITLSLVPALAACGLKVPTISGRGLELTGGTLDKLESIPGYNVNQSTESMRRILHKVGCCIVGQTDTLVPADKKMYCTRDVTGTVDNLPLIIGSIMSKKCVENLDALVLDVKTGCGAVIPDKDIARDLAKRMRNVGQSLGIKTTAFLTDMDQPTGYKIGNALEIAETLECLRGEGPASTQELIEVEGGYLMYNVNKASTPEEGRTMIAKALKDGSAMKKFYQMLKAQGVGKEDAYKLCYSTEDMFSVLPKAKLQTRISALSTGYVTGINAFKCGKLNCWIGAGRVKIGQPIDHAVGLELHVQTGDHINKGDPWVTVHHNQELLVEQIKMIQEAITVSTDRQHHGNKSLILEII